ncbi:hypothetical protein [Phenylobacterium sp.]|uniref:hypothetical protein n=1 Tax=Phenylobacterium sp. TaxID=1871053 RepID=UPI0035B18258
MRTDLRSSGRDGGAWLIAALLAVALRVLVPQGYMADHRNDLPFALVICTAQGAVALDASKLPQPNAPAHGAHKPAPCAFAGLGAAPPLASAAPPAPARFVVVAAPRLHSTAVRPGQGLAAPPPPATGPPLLI